MKLFLVLFGAFINFATYQVKAEQQALSLNTFLNRLEEFNSTLTKVKEEIGKLDQRISSIENGLTVQEAQRLKRSINNLRLPAVMQPTVYKGRWIFSFNVDFNRGLNRFRTVSSNFVVPFNTIPTVFYTVRTHNVLNNQTIQYKVASEIITTRSLTTHFNFYGMYSIFEFEIEWVAFGF